MSAQCRTCGPLTTCSTAPQARSAPQGLPSRFRASAPTAQRPRVTNLQATGPGGEEPCAQQGQEGSLSQGSRRSVLAAGVGTALAAAAAGFAPDVSIFGTQPAHAAALAPALPTKPIISANGEFMFSYPSKWLLAFDRSASAKPLKGALVFVGDFGTVDTFSVLKYTPEALGLTRAQFGDEAVVADALMADNKYNSGTMTFTTVDTGSRVNPVDGRKYVDVEYIVESCKGRIEAGLNGVQYCLGPNEMELQRVVRHHRVTATVQGDYLYVASGSAVAGRWNVVGGDVRAAVDSFAFRA